MHGKTVVTSDDHKAGHVVGEEGDYLIVETGTLRKHKHVLPKAFAGENGDDRVVATVTWDILKDAPEVGSDGNIPYDAVAQHYGLAGGFAEPETEGYGATVGEDPAFGAEQAAAAGGVTTAEQDRVATRRALSETSGNDRPNITSPGVTGGDRYRDSPNTEPMQGGDRED